MGLILIWWYRSIYSLTVLLRRFTEFSPMARITINDCLDHIPNHFDLTLVAAKRARQLARGAEAKLPWGTHKSTVLSLKEIAAGFVTTAVLTEVDLPAIMPPKMDLSTLDPIYEI